MYAMRSMFVKIMFDHYMASENASRKEMRYYCVRAPSLLLHTFI